MSVLELQDVDSQSMRDKLKSVHSPYDGYDNYEAHATESFIRVTKSLPEDAVAALLSFRNNPNSPSVLLIKNCPIDEVLGHTPDPSQNSLSKKTYVSESFLTGSAQILGDIMGFGNERNGGLIHQVAPSEKFKDALSSAGAKKPLALHTEITGLKQSPDYLVLLCLRQDHDKIAETTVSSLDIALKSLEYDVIQKLTEPEFIHSLPNSFFEGTSLENSSQVTVPVLRDHNGKYDISLNFLKTNATSPEFSEPLLALREALKSVETPIKLEPGDMLVINNRKALHSRNSFQPRFDGEDRWLQRVYVRKNLFDVSKPGQVNHRIYP